MLGRDKCFIFVVEAERRLGEETGNNLLNFYNIVGGAWRNWEARLGKFYVAELEKNNTCRYEDGI